MPIQFAAQDLSKSDIRQIESGLMIRGAREVN